MVNRGGVVRALVMAMLVLSLAALIVHAQATDQAQVEAARYLGAGIGFGLAALGAGIGIGLTGAASVSAMIERRELFAMYLLFVAWQRL
ncbi:ATPase [Vulcanisaeta distributa]|uniref:ATPase n=1 Tax=Vulcanisaeta distributa TaxID=164451 RepID=UPI000AAB474C|nr:ATPase [Vulcanisaeta distributa]